MDFYSEVILSMPVSDSSSAYTATGLSSTHSTISYTFCSSIFSIFGVFGLSILTSVFVISEPLFYWLIVVAAYMSN